MAAGQGGSHPGGGLDHGPIPGEVSELDGASPMGRYVGHGDEGAGEAGADAACVGDPGEGASATAGAEP